MTFLQVALVVVTMISIGFGLYSLGRRHGRDPVARWRDEYEAANTRAERFAATITEKDILLASKDEALAGQGKRLAEKDQIISELGGTRVAEILSTLVVTLERHEERATERHAEIARFLRHLNGKD